MTGQQKHDFVRQSIDSALSTIQADPWLAKRITHQKQDPVTIPQKKALLLTSLFLVLLLSTAAFAMVKSYGSWIICRSSQTTKHTWRVS